MPQALDQSLNVPPVPKLLAPLPLPMKPVPMLFPVLLDVVSPPLQFQVRPEQTQVTSP